MRHLVAGGSNGGHARPPHWFMVPPPIDQGSSVLRSRVESLRLSTTTGWKACPTKPSRPARIRQLQRGQTIRAANVRERSVPHRQRCRSPSGSLSEGEHYAQIVETPCTGWKPVQGRAAPGCDSCVHCCPKAESAAACQSSPGMRKAQGAVENLVGKLSFEVLTPMAGFGYSKPGRGRRNGSPSLLSL